MGERRTFHLVTMLALATCLGAIPSLSSAQSERENAFALEQQGKISEAEAAWHSVAAQHPTDAEPYAHLGFLEARQEHYKQAVPLYRKALALNPAMPGLRLNLGLALFKGGEFKDAIQIFDRLLKTEPASSPEAQRLT